MKTVITFGVFDYLHIGHIRLFDNIRKAVGEPCRLVLAIHRTEYVQATKPGAAMFHTTEQRIEILNALRHVNDVLVLPDDLKYTLNIPFDVFARGEDQNNERIVAFQDWCIANGKEVIRMSRTPNICSSGIKEQLQR
jgi:cytidyltransferase-like protein